MDTSQKEYGEWKKLETREHIVWNYQMCLLFINDTWINLILEKDLLSIY